MEAGEKKTKLLAGSVFTRVVSQSLCCHGDILEGIFRNLFVAFWSNSQDDSWLKIQRLLGCWPLPGTMSVATPQVCGGLLCCK